MAEYTPILNLYKPNRLDSEPVDATLSENFEKIEAAYSEVLGQSQTAINTSEEAKTNASESKVLAEQVKYQFDQVVAEAGNNNPEVVQARGNEVNLNARLQQISASVTPKADKTYVDTLIQSVASSSPKGVYATLTALQTAFPTGNSNIYLVNADGGWYYWNGSAWTKGGTYQGVLGVSFLKGEFVTAAITINTATKTIDIAKDSAGNNIFAASAGGVLNLAATTLTYTDNGFNYVFADKSTGALSKADYSNIASYSTDSNKILLFSFYHAKSKLTAGNKHLFTIDGVNAANEYINTGYLKGSLIQGVVTINTTAKTIDIAKDGIQNIYILHTQGVATINPITLNYTDGGFNYVYLDITTNNVYVADFNTIATYKINKNMVMIFAFFSNLKRVYAENRSLYTIDGLKNGGWLNNDGSLYDTNVARIVMPDKLYLLKDTPYSILGANVLSPLRTWDTSRVNFELPLLTDTARSSEGVKILVSEECELNTQLAVSSDGYTRELFKNISIKVKDKANIAIPGSPVRVLHIGDSLTNASLPPSTKWWLNKLGIPSQMIGTMNNNYVYDYPIPNLPSASADIKGEGRGGWCITDYTGGRTHTDGSLLMRSGNPFWNPSTQAFDAQYYLTNNPSFTGYDFVNIWLGTNDLAYTVENGLKHPNDTAEKPANPVTIADVMAYFTSKLDIMINSFKAVNPNVKIAIMPPPHTGKNLVYGDRYRTLTDKIVTYYAGREDVVVLGNYMSIGLSAGMQRDINTQPTETRPTYSAENNTLLGQNSSNVHFGGHTQLSNAHWIASWIANKL